MPKKINRFNVDIDKKLKGSERKILTILGNMAKNHFLEGFRKGGGQTDASLGGWKERKNPGSRQNRGRALLVKTGNMRDNIKVTSVTSSEARVTVKDIPYAIYHNEGTRRLPKREFIGRSKELEKELEKRITKYYDNIFGV